MSELTSLQFPMHALTFLLKMTPDTVQSSNVGRQKRDTLEMSHGPKRMRAQQKGKQIVVPTVGEEEVVAKAIQSTIQVSEGDASSSHAPALVYGQ